MSVLDRAMLVTGYATLLVGFWAFTFELAREPGAPRPTRGIRGLKRARAIRERRLFALIEPSIRYLAARVSGRPFRAVLARLHPVIIESSHHLGLSEAELLACSVWSGACAAVLSCAATLVLDVSAIWVPVFTTAGLLLPYARMHALRRARMQRVTWGLPSIIELASMCMGAGLDFPSSLRRVMESAPNPDEPIVEELAWMLRELDLGCTRREALLGFARRVPTGEVRELVNSATQAEEKGSPLARTLKIQAQTLRLRRSVSAEQAASSAALMLVGPTALIFVCVIALLLGPVVVRFMTGGVGAP